MNNNNYRQRSKFNKLQKNTKVRKIFNKRNKSTYSHKKSKICKPKKIFN